MKPILPVLKVVGDPSDCQHRFDASSEEKESLDWLIRVLDRMAAGCGVNRKKAELAQGLIGRLLHHDSELHLKLHQIESFVDGVFFTSPGGAKLETDSGELN
jgi:hypothetical protein